MGVNAKKKKPTPINAFEAVEKAREKRGGEVPTTLMGNQDTAHKGDTGGDAKMVMISFKMSEQKRAALKAYAKHEGVTVTHLLINAIDKMLDEGGF